MSDRTRYRIFVICFAAMGISTGWYIANVLGGDSNMGTRVGLVLGVLMMVTSVMHLWSFRVLPKEKSSAQIAK